MPKNAPNMPFMPQGCSTNPVIPTNSEPAFARSDHRAIIELTCSGIVDNVSDHTKNCFGSIIAIIINWDFFPPAVLKVYQVRAWALPIALHPELIINCTN